MLCPFVRGDGGWHNPGGPSGSSVLILYSSWCLLRVSDYTDS